LRIFLLVAYFYYGSRASSFTGTALSSIITFSSGSTTLLYGGLSTWIDSVAAMKVDFVVALVVVVAKVDSLRWHRLLWWRRRGCCCFNCYSYRLFLKGCWLLCWFLTLLFQSCVRAAVGGGMMLVEGFLCMVGEGFGTTFVFLCLLLLFDS